MEETGGKMPYEAVLRVSAIKICIFYYKCNSKTHKSVRRAKNTAMVPGQKPGSDQQKKQPYSNVIRAQTS